LAIPSIATPPPKVLKNKKTRQSRNKNRTLSGRHSAAESLVGRAGGEATFKPTSWARQRAWRIESLQLVGGARSDNKLYFVTAPAP